MARPPKPRDLKIVQGTFDASRDRAGVPKATGRPIKPRWLTGKGAALWKLKVSQGSWLAAADSELLALWCRAVADLDDGPVGISRMDAIRRLGSELGFTPPGRVRLGARVGGKKPDPADKYF